MHVRVTGAALRMLMVGGLLIIGSSCAIMPRRFGSEWPKCLQRQYESSRCELSYDPAGIEYMIGLVSHMLSIQLRSFSLAQSLTLCKSSFHNSTIAKQPCFQRRKAKALAIGLDKPSTAFALALDKPQTMSSATQVFQPTFHTR